MMKIVVLRARGAEPDSRCAQGDEHLAAQALVAAGVLMLLLTLWPGTDERIVEMEL
jgi:hypothetical protein